ncbi:MAG: SIS domain-containing protein [Chloroflexi bacterium]|nr:MAG: SIS domain-containing protein [Chloroflexota bacterium]
MNVISTYLQEVTQVIQQLPQDTIEAIIDAFAQARDEGRTIFLMGNGGSGSTASHMANDLIKNTIQPGKPRLRVIALTDNMPIILAIANDWDYSRIFVEQLIPLARPGDLLVGLSGSGNSPNVLKAMDWARENGLRTIGLTGRDGGQLKDKADLSLIVPTQSMAQIEDVHLMLGHIIYLGLLER